MVTCKWALFIRPMVLPVLLVVSSPEVLSAQVNGALSLGFSVGNETMLQVPLPKIQIDFYLDQNWFVGVSAGLGVGLSNGRDSWWNAGLLGGYRNGSFLLENSISYFSREASRGQLGRISINPKIGVAFFPIFLKAGPSFNLATWDKLETEDAEAWGTGTLHGTNLQMPNFEIGYRIDSDK